MATGTADEIEEERRLLYVAMTRAKEELHLIVPQRFFVRQQSVRGDHHLYAGRSRFIPEELMTLFEGCAWPVPDPIGAEPQATPVVPFALAVRLRALFE